MLNHKKPGVGAHTYVSSAGEEEAGGLPRLNGLPI